MKKKLLKIFFSISPILCIAPFLYFAINQTSSQNKENQISIDKNNTINYSRSSKQTIADCYEVSDYSNNITFSGETKNILENNAYPWEIPYILNYECNQKLKYNDSLLTKELFKIKNSIFSGCKKDSNGGTITQQFSVNDLFLYQINTTYISNGKVDFYIYLSDSQNNILRLNYETSLQFKNTTPSTKVILNGDYSDINPSDIKNNVLIRTEFLQKIKVYTTVDETYGYRILPFNNNNDKLKKFYDNGTIQVPINQPTQNVSIDSSDDNAGTVGLNISLESNNNFCQITGFDSQGIPFNFSSGSNLASSYSFSYNLVTRLPKETRPWIFRGDDGNFLMWTIITVSILVFVNILVIIIFYVGVSRKEYKIYRRNLHRVINSNKALKNTNLPNNRIPYENVTTNNDPKKKLEYSNDNRTRNIR